MGSESRRKRRRSIRLKGYDYSQPGAYFVTICVRGGECLLGEVDGCEMRLNEWGEIAAAAWVWLEDRHPYVQLDAWVVMPNHLHGIVVLREIDTVEGGGVPEKRKPLGRLVGAFKTVSTKRINELRGTPGEPFWQRNYWEHVIRNERALRRIQEYIVNNSERWAEDGMHPDAPANPFVSRPR